MDTGGVQSETMDFTSAKRARSAQIAQLTKLYSELENFMVSYDNIENVKRVYGKLCDRLDHSNFEDIDSTVENCSEFRDYPNKQ